MSPDAEFTEQVRRIAGELARLDDKLDFSKESLGHLEEKLKENADADFARAAGAYLAEVIMRRSPVKLRWVEAKRVYAAWNDADNPWVLATPKNLVFAVLGKPLKHDTTLVDFAEKVQHLCSREATSAQ